MNQKSPPYKPDAFHSAMRDIAGVNPFGETRIRAVWGGDAVDERGELKYYTVRRVGFAEGVAVLFLDTGETVAFRNMEELDASVGDRPYFISGPCAPMLEKVGDERWYLEWWVSPEHLAGMPATGSRTAGERVWNKTTGIGDFPRTGIWQKISRVENPDGSYRTLDFGVIQACKAFVEKMKKWNMLRPGEVDPTEACEEVLRDCSPDPSEERRVEEEMSRYIVDRIEAITKPKVSVKENIV